MFVDVLVGVFGVLNMLDMCFDLFCICGFFSVGDLLFDGMCDDV